jgi:hypothetical protein
MALTASDYHRLLPEKGVRWCGKNLIVPPTPDTDTEWAHARNPTGTICFFKASYNRVVRMGCITCAGETLGRAFAKTWRY